MRHIIHTWYVFFSNDFFLQQTQDKDDRVSSPWFRFGFITFSSPTQIRELLTCKHTIHFKYILIQSTLIPSSDCEVRYSLDSFPSISLVSLCLIQHIQNADCLFETREKRFSFFHFKLYIYLTRYVFLGIWFNFFFHFLLFSAFLFQFDGIKAKVAHAWRFLFASLFRQKCSKKVLLLPLCFETLLGGRKKAEFLIPHLSLLLFSRKWKSTEVFLWKIQLESIFLE